MGLPRSTFDDGPMAQVDDAEIVARMRAICDEFEAYGYRRVGAALRHQAVVVNGKKIRRLMRAHDLQPRRRRRFVATTDSDHDRPIFPDRAKGMVVDGPNQLWVADLTYIAIATGFVYLAAILDAWSRRVVGYAISHSVDARLTLAALKPITDLAEHEGVTDAYVCRLLPLTCLAPDIVEAILDGRQSKGLRVAEVLGNAPLGWKEQRTNWGFSN